MPDVVAAGLVKRFGAHEALAGVDLVVPSGQMCGLVGADGAGKTTLLRCIAGALRPDAGQVLPGPGHARDVGFAQQGFHLYPDLTVGENLAFFGSLFGMRATAVSSRARELLEFAGLAGAGHLLAANLSGGMRQKLSLACALLHAPRILLLDEPTTGIDPLSRGELWDLFEQLHAGGSTVVVASAYLDEVERCERVVFLDAGRVRMTGTPEQLRRGYATLEEAIVAEMTR